MKISGHLSLLVTLIFSSTVTGQTLAIGFGETGLSSIRFGTELLARGSFMVNKVDFVSLDGKISAGSLQCKTTEDAADRSQVLAFDWGRINVGYNQKGNNLALAIRVLNQTNLTLKAMSLDALAIKLPSPPREYDGKTPMLATNLGAPSLLPLSYRGGSILVTNEDVTRPLLLGIPWPLNGTAKTIFPIRINTGRDPMYPGSLPFIDRPIPPGKQDALLISLRFSASEASVSAAQDVLTRFTGLHEFTLHWPDRRAIGSLILATAATKWSGNPRGWLLDPNINIHTPEGLADFHKRVLAWADHSIAILRKMNAQGMITWDIEGEEFPHPTTYIGDPSTGATLAPEMAIIVDEYFSRFTKAGLRVGVTIRPQRLDQSTGTPHQIEASDPTAELIRKISFARKRWGATLFYIDSNGDAVLPLSSDVLTKVARTFPDVLLIPEHKNVAYYAGSAPYSESRGGTYATSALVTAIYPKSFSIINTADGDVQKHYSELLAAVNRGDILLFRGWFDDPANAAVKTIYENSNFKAH